MAKGLERPSTVHTTIHIKSTDEQEPQTKAGVLVAVWVASVGVPLGLPASGKMAPLGGGYRGTVALFTSAVVCWRTRSALCLSTQQGKVPSAPSVSLSGTMNDKVNPLRTRLSCLFLIVVSGR